MAAPISTIDDAVPATGAPAPARAAAPVQTTGIVLALLVAAALLLVVPPAGRFAFERASTLGGTKLQALCSRPGATPADLASVLCTSLLRPRSVARSLP
jgi:hypothetical protein